MRALTLVALWLLTGAADDLVMVKVDGLSLQVPAAWTHKADNGTYHYTAPSDDGAFDLSVYSLPPRHARLCLDQLIEALGGEKGWDRLRLDGQPAARKVQLDDGNSRKGEYATHTYLGCNGKLKWVLSFTMKQAKKDRFEPLAGRIAESIHYLGTAAPE